MATTKIAFAPPAKTRVALRHPTRLPKSLHLECIERTRFIGPRHVSLSLFGLSYIMGRAVRAASLFGLMYY